MRATTVTSQDGLSNILWITGVITGLTSFHQTIKENKETPMTKLLTFLMTIYLSPEPTFQKFSCVHSNNDKK